MVSIVAAHLRCCTHQDSAFWRNLLIPSMVMRVLRRRRLAIEVAWRYGQLCLNFATLLMLSDMFAVLCCLR